VVLSIKQAEPRKMVKRKDVVYGVVVRTRKAMRRKDGSYISFSDNAVVIINGKGKQAKEPRANRIIKTKRNRIPFLPITFTSLIFH
jgi:large subunit ribosomal protein L14